MIVDVTYSVNGLIGPMTDTVEVPDQYTATDVECAVNTLLVSVSQAMDKHLSIRHLLLTRPHRP